MYISIKRECVTIICQKYLFVTFHGNKKRDFIKTVIAEYNNVCYNIYEIILYKKGEHSWNTKPHK